MIFTPHIALAKPSVTPQMMRNTTTHKGQRLEKICERIEALLSQDTLNFEVCEYIPFFLISVTMNARIFSFGLILQIVVVKVTHR